MQALSNILHKAFVVTYYRKNAGFFLFLLYILFGMEQKPILFHRELIQSIVTGKNEMLVTLIIFLLYHLKCLYFILRKMRSGQYQFIAEMQSYQPLQQAVALAAAYILLAAPFSLYCVCIIAVAIKSGLILSAAIAALFQLSVHTICIFIWYRAIQKGFTRRQRTAWSRKLPVVKKTMFWLPLCYSLGDGQWRLVVVKFFSLLLLSIVCVWNRNDYTFSDFLLFFQLSIAAHAALVLDYVEFLETKFFVRRNLPVPVWKIFLSYLLCYLIIALPEILSMFYFGIGQQPPTNAAIMALMYIGELLLFTAVLYEKGMTKERYFTYVAAIAISMLLIASFKIFWITAMGVLAISFSLFQIQFYRYEPNIEQKDHQK